MKSNKTIVYLTKKYYLTRLVFNLKSSLLTTCSLFLAFGAFSQNGVGVNTLVPKSSFDDVGSFGKKVTNITATTTLSEIHSTVVCDNTADITVTLPAASSCARRIYEIKRSSISTNLVTISGTIDGVANYLLSYPNQSITIFSDSSKWLSRDGSGDNNAWKLTGNIGTVAGTNFIGTTDAIDFVLKANNAERMRVLSTGNIGIGTIIPKSLFQIQGSFAKKVVFTGTTGLTLNASHSTIVCNNAATAITLTLPAASTCPGRIYDIKKDALSTANVTLSGTVDATTNLVLTGINTAATIISDSTEWKTMQGGQALNGTAWALKGNSGTDTSSHFIGPTDGNGLIFRIGNSKRMKILTDGRVHVGNLNPQQKFSVQGGITLDQANENTGKLGSPCLRFGHFGGEAIGSRRNVAVSDSNYKGLEFYTDSRVNMSIVGAFSGDPFKNGNVGITTLVPSARLHVVGQIQIGTPGVADYAGTLLTNIATSTNTNAITKKGVEITSTGVWGNTATRNIGVHVSNVSGAAFNYDAILNGGGDVGIGTNTPNARLEVEKNANNKNILSVQNTNAAGYSSIDYFNETDTLSFTTGYGNSGSGFPKLGYISTYRKDFIITHLGSTTHDFYLKGAITGAGLASIGIGTNAPQQNLSVQNGMNIDQAEGNNGTIANTLRFGSGSTEGIGSNRSGAGVNQDGLDFYTGSANRMLITSSGYVGISAASPATYGRLTVMSNGDGGAQADNIAIVSRNATPSPSLMFYSSTGSEASKTNVANGSNIMNIHAYARINGVDNQETARITSVYTGNGTTNLSSLAFANSGTNIRMFIADDGNVGIGTTVPEEVLHVYKTGVAPAGPAILLESNGGGTKIMSYKIRTWEGMDANAYVGYGAVDDGASSSRAAIYVPNGAAVKEAVSILKVTGNVGLNTTAPTSLLSVNGTADKAGGGAWGTFSDKRLKKDIVDYSDGLDKLMKIHAVKFKYNGKGPYNDTSTEYIGVIAQEIKEVAPYTVSTYKTKLNPEDKEDTELLKFDGSSLQYLLINSVKELKNEVDALKKEIEILKAAKK